MDADQLGRAFSNLKKCTGFIVGRGAIALPPVKKSIQNERLRPIYSKTAVSHSPLVSDSKNKSFLMCFGIAHIIGCLCSSLTLLLSIWVYLVTFAIHSIKSVNDKRQNSSSSLLALQYQLFVVHYIIEGLQSLASPPPPLTDVTQKCTV